MNTGAARQHCARWKRWLISILAASATLPAAADKGHWQNAGYLVQSFVEIALRNEYSPKPDPVRKWTGPVNYFLVHRVGDEELHQRLVRVHFEHLAEITGLRIRPAETRADANFLIVLSSEETLRDDLLHYFGWRSATRREKFFRESVCLAKFSTGADKSITGAVAIIPVDRARARGKLVACVVEELTQVMGLPNDSDKVFPSVFNDRSTDEFLSGLDYLLLKMLYDPRVKAGMDEKTAIPVLQAIAGEYERDNRFQNAGRMAAERGLAGWSP